MAEEWMISGEVPQRRKGLGLDMLTREPARSFL